MKLPQLSLRDLFWLVALVAMGCGWWVDRQRIAKAWKKVELAKAMTAAKHDLLLESARFQLDRLNHAHEEWQRIKERLDSDTRAKVEAAEAQEIDPATGTLSGCTMK